MRNKLISAQVAFKKNHSALLFYRLNKGLFVLLFCLIGLTVSGQSKRVYSCDRVGLIIDTIEQINEKSTITISKKEVIVEGCKPLKIKLFHPFKEFDIPPYVMAKEHKGIFISSGKDSKGKHVGLYHDTNKKLLQVAYIDQLYVYSEMALHVE